MSLYTPGEKTLVFYKVMHVSCAGCYNANVVILHFFKEENEESLE